MIFFFLTIESIGIHEFINCLFLLIIGFKRLCISIDNAWCFEVFNEDVYDSNPSNLTIKI